MSSDRAAIVSYLREFGLQQYADVLYENEFTRLAELALITPQDLLEMGIKKVGARKKLMVAVSRLGAAPDALSALETLNFKVLSMPALEKPKYATADSYTADAPGFGPWAHGQSQKSRPKSAQKTTAALSVSNEDFASLRDKQHALEEENRTMKETIESLRQSNDHLVKCLVAAQEEAELHKHELAELRAERRAQKKEIDELKDGMEERGSDEEEELNHDEADGSMMLYPRSPRKKPKLATALHDEVMESRNALLERLDRENKILESINQEAEELLQQAGSEERTTKEIVLEGRLTNAYEIATHIGVESASIAATFPANYHQLMLTQSGRITPHRGQAPRRFITADGPTGMSEVARRKSMATLDPDMVAKALHVDPHCLIQNPAKNRQILRITDSASAKLLSEPRKKVTKTDWERVFEEQNEQFENIERSKQGYEKMLDNYFQVQQAVSEAIKRDPWSSNPRNIVDSTEARLKRRLSRLIGIELSESYDSPLGSPAPMLDAPMGVMEYQAGVSEDQAWKVTSIAVEAAAQDGQEQESSEEERDPNASTFSWTALS
eukprot:NODE_394_length_2304_cov_26.096674_g365_i0.p1 GENE.NODE_394_length_2304_cov_26.096674_g365_i0~~NODE_394_length_2304_cov_26.096674_g365_i0.p1  ORF type:complete len:555 (-),score=114.50 NODE_394_length_2304_cov_26.096674_g365_i0:505-2169(-)